MWRRSSVLAATAALAAATAARAQAPAPGVAFASDISPFTHAQPGWNVGPQAGGEIRFGDTSGPEPSVRRLGLTLGGQGAKVGEGRWFVFAGARSGQVASHPDESAWASLGWNDERASASMTSAQAGIALRKGDAQASFGYVRRRFKVSGAQSDLLANMPKSDHLAGFSFSWTLR
jgi:hypothetical protein